MNYQLHKVSLLFCFVGWLLIGSGCVPPTRRPARICPGKDSVTQSISALQFQRQNIRPFEAKGNCVFRFYENKKRKKENLTVSLYFNGPFEIYFKGDAGLIAKALVVGANEEEFWLLTKPKELGNQYVWGRWADQRSLGQMLVSPATLLEALGVADVAGEDNWTLSNRGAFDILTQRNGQDKIAKKIYINCCDYLVRKIAYFDKNGERLVTTLLDSYKRVSDDFFVPCKITIATRNKNGSEDVVEIKLRTPKEAEFSAKKRNYLFSLPKTKGFKNIYRIIDGIWVEEQ